MARFTGTLDETYDVPRDVATCVAHFLDLDAVQRNYQGLHAAERLDDQTLRLTLEERQQLGHTFVGTYTCRWEPVGDDGVRWRTIGDDNNMWVSADLRFTPTDGGSRVHWSQQLELEIPVNRIAAKLLDPVVTRLMASGLRGYAHNMLRDLGAEV